MVTKSRPSLSKQIVSILNEHGPVSIEVLHRMTNPPSPKVNLRQSLSILKKKGVVQSANIDVHTTFYYLSPFQGDLENAAKIIRSDQKLNQPSLLRKQDWIHNQWTEYWICMISRMFPEAVITREKSVGADELAQNVLLLKQRDFDMMPDFLVSFPKSDSTVSTHVAFEIERTRKSHVRILRKFRKYLNGTKIDGLIYICDTGGLAETIRLLYENKLVDQAQRIKHYRDHFFLFSDSLVGGGPNMDRMFNAKAELVDLKHWIDKLRTTKWTQRRDTEFK